MILASNMIEIVNKLKISFMQTCFYRRFLAR